MTYGPEGQCFCSIFQSQLYPAQRAGISSKMNLYSGPAARGAAKRLDIYHSTKILALRAIGHNLG